MNLSKDGKSPMIIKKGDSTPPRVAIGERETLFAYLKDNKIPYEEAQIPKEILEEPTATISYEKGQFVFHRHGKGGDNRGTEVSMDSSTDNNKKSKHVPTGTESCRVNVTNDSSQGSEGQMHGPMSTTDPSVSQTDFLPNRTGLTEDGESAGTPKADPPASPTVPGLPEGKSAGKSFTPFDKILFTTLLSKAYKDGLSLEDLGVSAGDPQETASKPDESDDTTPSDDTNSDRTSKAPTFQDYYVHFTSKRFPAQGKLPILGDDDTATYTHGIPPNADRHLAQTIVDDNPDYKTRPSVAVPSLRS